MRIDGEKEKDEVPEPEPKEDDDVLTFFFASKSVQIWTKFSLQT